MKRLSFLDAYNRQVETKLDYFRQYTYDHPVMITRRTDSDLKFVQQSLIACIRHFIENHEKFSHIMPLSDSVLRIINLYKGIEYKPGTYRTDFLITDDNQIKIIEITCRFALNGFLSTGFVNNCALPFINKHQIEIEDKHTPFFLDLEQYLGDPDRVIIIQDDKRYEGKYVREMLELAGREVINLTFEDLPKKCSLFNSSACFSQMRHDEWFSLPEEVVLAYINSIHLNDLRTVLIVHDKRFFSVLNDDDFRKEALGETDAERFKMFLTPTYTKAMRPDLWERLPHEKNDWIIKPPVFGMGIGITAGLGVDDETWSKALSSFLHDDVIFQPYLKQKRFSGSIGSEQRLNDYAVGTLLYFQDEYYGPGLFRASNNPVTNHGDDRKISAITLLSEDISMFDNESEWLI